MLKIRKAQFEDCEAVFSLRNDPSIRKSSFNAEELSYNSHQAWFKKSLNSFSRRIFIIEDEEEVVQGVVRFDLDEKQEEAVVSIFVSAKTWGKGIGSFALEQGELLLKQEFEEIKKIIARVKYDNEASVRLFSKNNYIPTTIEFQKEII